MKNHKIAGGGGAQLHVVEAGNPTGRPILFIHGYAQCWRCWNRQLDSDLANDHRLVAMDMRGHGLSDKPQEAYADSRLWADDIHAVIQVLKLDRPVLSGWSYGPLLALDYIRHYGEDAIGGINIIGGVSKLGGEDALAVLTPEFLSLIPGFFSAEAEESKRSLESLTRLCFVQELSTEEVRRILDDSLLVPTHVRKGLFHRVVDNDDVLQRIGKPVLITHGAKDAVVKLSALDHHKARLPHAQTHIMNTGHAAFLEDVPGYNRRLREFCASL
ncbi:MAG: alpha/beta fold hydrolase [Candidatus Sulfotelmatobacter sp.]